MLRIKDTDNDNEEDDDNDDNDNDDQDGQDDQYVQDYVDNNDNYQSKHSLPTSQRGCFRLGLVAVGQGCQIPGVMLGIAQNFELAKDMLAVADRVLGYELSKKLYFAIAVCINSNNKQQATSNNNKQQQQQQQARIARKYGVDWWQSSLTD
jgi:hypothetical protein